jgi:hypothetical protein
MLPADALKEEVAPAPVAAPELSDDEKTLQRAKMLASALGMNNAVFNTTVSVVDDKKPEEKISTEKKPETKSNLTEKGKEEVE